ncbi:hypothetical protein WR25_13009 [Diploscapter pachys]|uniref:Innexin n=1 Tax=Diploscapter pachys TaxID=2018661 RepID=A0A2A2L1A7_9BILA|nr:hypothetical protein WR25_13009 [Diploscapter pachys]
MIVVPYVEDVFVNWFRSVAFDDAIDRLNYVYTASLMYLFAIVVSAKQYAGTPIQCWVPAEFKPGWKQYVEDYCFIQNTFFVSFEKEIPNENSDRTEAEIGYYQWVPIVLALQAIMFHMPSWLWATLHKFGGLDLTTAMTDAEKIAAAPSASEDRKKEISKLSFYLEECLKFGKQQRTPVQLFCFRFGRGLGSYVTLLYLLVKGLYVANILTQFYILNRFLGSSYLFWGIQTFVDLYNGREWMDSGVFPRVTLCDFQVRRLGNIHRYTAQCVLSINMINEKIYLFIWFWFLFVAVVTTINFFYTVLYMSLALLREKSTRQWLKRTVEDEDENKCRYKKAVRDFCHQVLGPDGVLTLRFIESHVGGIVVRDVAAKMFNDYITSLHPSSTQTTSSDIPDDGAHESRLYVPSKPHDALMMPDYPTKADH